MSVMKAFIHVEEDATSKAELDTKIAANPEAFTPGTICVIKGVAGFFVVQPNKTTQKIATVV